jgi:hypothetical protein
MKSLRMFEFRALFSPHKQIMTHNRCAFESLENEVRWHMNIILAWNRGKTAITRTLYRVDDGEGCKDRFAETFQLPFGQKHCSGVLLPCTYVSYPAGKPFVKTAVLGGVVARCILLGSGHQKEQRCTGLPVRETDTIWSINNYCVGKGEKAIPQLLCCLLSPGSAQEAQSV